MKESNQISTDVNIHFDDRKQRNKNVHLTQL